MNWNKTEKSWVFFRRVCRMERCQGLGSNTPCLFSFRNGRNVSHYISIEVEFQQRWLTEWNVPSAWWRKKKVHKSVPVVSGLIEKPGHFKRLLYPLNKLFFWFLFHPVIVIVTTLLVLTIMESFPVSKIYSLWFDQTSRMGFRNSSWLTRLIIIHEIYIPSSAEFISFHYTHFDFELL